MKPLPPAQQFRRSTGEFLNKQDDPRLNQTQQNDRIKFLAAYPGRHKGNAARQDLANATLNLMAFLSVLQPGQGHLPLQTLHAENRIPPGALNPESIGKQIKSVTPAILFPELPAPVTNNNDPDSLYLPNTATQQLSRSRRDASYSTQEIQQASVKSDASTQGAITNDNTRLSFQEMTRVRYQVQNQLLDEMLAKNNRYTYGIPSSVRRVNELVAYIKESKEERIDEVARLLLSASGIYGEKKEEHLSEAQKHAIIAEYLNQAVLGMSLDSWCLQQAHLMRMEDNSLFDQGNLQHRLTRLLNSEPYAENLSSQARLFYQDESLKKILPTFLLTLEPQEKEELEKMKVNDPRWAFIHAGAMLLSSSGAEFSTVSLKELEEIGVTLDILLRKGAVPQEYIEFFKIPALFDYVTYYQNTSEDALHDTDKMREIYQFFLENIGAWAKENNPLSMLPDLVNNWKTRTELAREMLERNDISEDLLDYYLNSHSEVSLPVKYRFERKKLPNIDIRFAQQNRKLEVTAHKVDKFLLPYAFDSLSADEQQFIENAKVERVTAVFNAWEQVRGVPLPPSARRGMQNSGALVYHVPDRIDLLSCTRSGQERIYALRTLSSGEYNLERVDRKREKMLDLLDDSFVPTMDKDYKLKITSHTTLKESDGPATTLIEALANLHSKKLRSWLDEKGYDKTGKEKAAEIFLSLIPFYSCISESIKGDAEKAVSACLMDIVGVLPMAGLMMNTGLRFGTALSRAAVGAISYGLREATVNTILRQAGAKMINQFPLIAKEISPQVLRNLGVAFLRSLDPGVELLSRTGLKGINVLKAIAKSSTNNKGLNLLATALDKIKIAELKIDKFQTATLFDPQSRRWLEVANAGKENGQPFWVQFNRETGEFFEQKYRLDPQGELKPIISPLTERLESLKQQSIKIGLRLMNPGDPQPSGSRHTPQFLEPVLFMPGYNELPPLADNVAKFNEARKISNVFYPPPMPEVSNTQIQRLEKFIPVYPICVVDSFFASQKLKNFIDNMIVTQPWRAFPGFALNVPPHISWIQPRIRANLLKSKRMFYQANDILATIDYNRLMEHRVGKYFAGMLGTERVDVIAESVRRFSEIVSNSRNLIQASEEVDFSNIITISTDLVKSPEDPTQYITPLTEDELNELPLGMTYIPDAEGRIVFFADAFLERHAVLEADNLSVNSRDKLTPAETFLHEFTHVSSRTSDIFKVFIATKREKLNGEQLRASFIRDLYFKNPGSSIPKIFNNPDFRFYFALLRQNQGITVPLTEPTIVRAIMADKMLFANLMILDADVIARTITALVNNRPFNARYKQKREAVTPDEARENSIDLVEGDENTLNMMSLILAQVSAELLKKEGPVTATMQNQIAPHTIKYIKINDVTLKVQLYGDTENENLLLPEIHEIIPTAEPLNVDEYKTAFYSLLPDQRKALRSWATKTLKHTLNYKDSTPGLIGGVNPKLNKDLLKNIPLAPKELNTYNKLMEVFKSQKIVARCNYVRGTCYINGTYNPWLEDAIEINDYLTTYPAFMSVSTDPSHLITTIFDASDNDNHIDSLVFYKIENATGAMPLLPVAPANSPLKNEYLYPPNSLFKVKSLVYSAPDSVEASYANREMYLPNRVAVELTEVNEQEAKNVKVAKNIFTGEAVLL